MKIGSSALVIGFAIMLTSIMIIFDVLLQLRMEDYGMYFGSIKLYFFSRYSLIFHILFKKKK
jgi:hypothetical protein